MGTLSRVQFSQSEQENCIKCKTGSGDQIIQVDLEKKIGLQKDTGIDEFFFIEVI